MLGQGLEPWLGCCEAMLLGLGLLGCQEGLELERERE